MNVTKGLLLAALALFTASPAQAQTATLVICGDARCNAHATAVHIGDGQVLTARHVVPTNPAREDTHAVWRALLSTGDTMPLLAVAYFDEVDMALLKMLGDPPAGMEAAEPDCRDMQVGENVTIVGHPDTMRYVHIRGYVAAGPITPLPRLQDVALVIAPVLSGFSGSGVIAEDGRLLGIVTSMVANSNYGFVQPITKICDQLAAGQ